MITCLAFQTNVACFPKQFPNRFHRLIFCSVYPGTCGQTSGKGWPVIKSPRRSTIERPIERFSFDCREVIGFAFTTLRNWFK